MALQAEIPHKLVYKTYVKVRALHFGQVWDWSYSEGGLIAEFRHAKACNPYFV